jgi:chaperonin cofactor prefoldin
MENNREELIAKLDALLERLEIQIITVRVIGEEIQKTSEKLEKLISDADSL